MNREVEVRVGERRTLWEKYFSLLNTLDGYRAGRWRTWTELWSLDAGIVLTPHFMSMIVAGKPGSCAQRTGLVAPQSDPFLVRRSIPQLLTSKKHAESLDCCQTDTCQSTQHTAHSFLFP